MPFARTALAFACAAAFTIAAPAFAETLTFAGGDCAAMTDRVISGLGRLVAIEADPAPA